MVKLESSTGQKLTTITRAQQNIVHFNRSSHSILYYNVSSYVQLTCNQTNLFLCHFDLRDPLRKKGFPARKVGSCLVFWEGK